MFICSSVTAFSLLALSSFLLNSLLRMVSISTLSSVHGALSNFLCTISFWFMFSFFASVLLPRLRLFFPSLLLFCILTHLFDFSGLRMFYLLDYLGWRVL